MEIVGMGALLDEEWESLRNIFAFDAAGFGADQSLSHPTNSTFVAPCIDDNEYFYNYLPSILHPNNSISAFHSDNASDTTSYNFTSQSFNSYENCHFLPNDVLSPMNLRLMDQGNLVASFASAFPSALNVDGLNDSPIGSVEDNESDNLGSPLSTEVQIKRKSNAPEVEVQGKIKAAPKKKARVSYDMSKRSIESEKTDEDNVSNGGNSDDESKVSQYTIEGEITASKGKKRASRGTATDPQSLYARRRREKINERLKILQNLVPNGTKVDISTMLEEAVQYVKFLQLQIRLLSSDDLWMYAPIAYNGVDISLYRRISPFLLP